jgi:DNA-binding NarL/FixJ family response regulator
MMGVSPEPVPTVTARRRALVVLAAGPTRDAVRRLVAPLVDAVAVATDPFDGTARFAEAPADLVIASLSGWRRKDLAFVTTVRARRPHAAVLVLVPEGRRALAADALRAGADAALPEPVDLDELSLAARRLLDRLPAAGTGPDAALARLAAQIGHPVNNPLQEMSLLHEDPRRLEEPCSDPRAPGPRRAKAEIARRDAVEIVASFGRLPPCRARSTSPRS